MIHIDQVCVEHADRSSVTERENAGPTKAIVGLRRAMKQWKLNELEARKVAVEELVIMTPDPMIYVAEVRDCLLYTSPSPRDGLLSRMPSSA